MPNPTLEIRQMQQSDLGQVVEIHLKAFPGFFLTRMGRGFLRSYYQTVLDFGQSIAFVACNKFTAEPFGFVVGFTEPQAFYALFKQRRRRLLPSIGLALLRDPALLSEVLNNLRRVESQAKQMAGAVELSSIAVARAGGGTGSALLDTFVEQARLNDGNIITLTTDADDNDAVRVFYEKRGFVADGVELRGKRQLCRYVRVL